MTILLSVIAYLITGLAVIGLFLWWSDNRRVLHLLGFALAWPAILLMLVAMTVYDLANEDSKELEEWD